MLCKDFEGEWEWNFEHENKMHYGLQQLFVGSFIVLNDDPNQNIKCTKRRWEQVNILTSIKGMDEYSRERNLKM